MGNYVVITDQNFEEEVLKSNIPVVIDFWAEWCAPCKLLEPIVEQLSVEYNGKIHFAKMDVDSNPQVPMKYGIRSIPTLIFFKNGQAEDQLIGAVPKKNIIKKLESLL